jgi:alpha-D-ribose 1-methylphosphonate 5-triphosphate synthase subunit PhnG
VFGLPTFIDVHNERDDVTPKGLKDVYQRIPHEEVTFIDVWADRGTGTVFCVSEATNTEAVLRLHHEAGHTVARVYEAPLSF